MRSHLPLRLSMVVNLPLNVSQRPIWMRTLWKLRGLRFVWIIHLPIFIYSLFPSNCSPHFRLSFTNRSSPIPISPLCIAHLRPPLSCSFCWSMSPVKTYSTFWSKPVITTNRFLPQLRNCLCRPPAHHPHQACCPTCIPLSCCPGLGFGLLHLCFLRCVML